MQFLDLMELILILSNFLVMINCFRDSCTIFIKYNRHFFLEMCIIYPKTQVRLQRVRIAASSPVILVYSSTFVYIHIVHCPRSLPKFLLSFYCFYSRMQFIFAFLYYFRLYVVGDNCSLPIRINRYFSVFYVFTNSSRCWSTLPR